MPEPGSATLAYYDPHRLPEPDFLAGFVARGKLLDFLTRQLRLAAQGGVGRHYLIIGQRGMGKTTLLRRLAIAVEKDAELGGALIPLTFREEQYNVRSLGQFWQNCGEALAEALERAGLMDEADALDHEMQGPAWKREQAASSFCETVRRLGKRPILLVDNLDIILNAVPEEEHWQLRNLLQAGSGPLLYAAAAAIPEQVGDQRAAFYDFFRLELLDPLDQRELMSCIRRLAERREGGQAVLKVLREQPARVKVLHTLSGGNPRILTFIYGILERADSESVYSDLERLLDQLTPLYKARVEDLRTELQRSIFDAIALHWDPISSTKLSRIAAVQPGTLSGQLLRMRGSGLISEVPTSKARSGYQVAERFFNIWYLMRHGTRRTRQRMRWLTAFLQTFYTLEDLHGMLDRMGQDEVVGEWRPLYSEALQAAIADKNRSSRAERLPLRVAGKGEPEMVRLHGIRKGISLLAAGEAEAARKWFLEYLERHPNSAGAWDFLGMSFYPDQIDDAENAFRQAIVADPDYADPYIRLARVCSRKGDTAEADRLVRHALGLEPKNPWGWIELGRVLHDQRDSPGAEVALRKAIRLNPNGKKAAHIPDNELASLLLEQGRFKEAETHLWRAVDIAPGNWALWDRLGDALLAQRKAADAAEAFRRALSIAPEADWPHHGLGQSAFLLGRMEEAAQWFRKATRLSPQRHSFWGSLGQVLLVLDNDPEEALAAFRQAVATNPADSYSKMGLALVEWRHGDLANAEKLLREASAMNPSNYLALERLGRLLAETGRRDESRTMLEKAVQLNDNYSLTWVSLGLLLRDVGDEGAEPALLKAVELDPVSMPARSAIGGLLESQSRFRSAAEHYKAATRSHPRDANMWRRLGFLQGYHLGDGKAAETAFRTAFEISADPDLRQHLFWSLLWQRRVDEAVALKNGMGGVEPFENALMDAGIAIESSNFGIATDHLAQCLQLNLDEWRDGQFLAFLQLIRQFVRSGSGERLIEWLAAPERPAAAWLYAMALSALLHGERSLLDINPEMRPAVEAVYALLAQRDRSDGQSDGSPGASEFTKGGKRERKARGKAAR